MSSQKVPRPRRSQIRTIIYDPHTPSVIATRDRVIYPSREAYEQDQTAGDESSDAKICTVCMATLNHEPKCPNKQLRLEGANSLYAK